MPKIELQKYNVTLKDLKKLIEECDKINIPDDTILEIDCINNTDITLVKGILADAESIRFYDWT